MDYQQMEIQRCCMKIIPHVSFRSRNDIFRPCEDNEEVLGPEIPYLSAIEALMYLANCTRPDIVFATNLLARYKSSPTRRY